MLQGTADLVDAGVHGFADLTGMGGDRAGGGAERMADTFSQTVDNGAAALDSGIDALTGDNELALADAAEDGGMLGGAAPGAQTEARAQLRLEAPATRRSGGCARFRCARAHA